LIWTSVTVGWKKTTLSGVASIFRSAAKGDTLMAVAGSGGRIFIAKGVTEGSIDTWVGSESGTTKALNGIAAMSNRFVAVGDSGLILRSSSFSQLATSVTPSGSAGKGNLAVRVRGTALGISVPVEFYNRRFRISLYEYSGKKILETNVVAVGEISVPIAGLARGSYRIQVAGVGKTLTGFFTYL
jgi:hypothetical protein